MEQEKYEQYEYARKRVVQKKWLYYHTVVLAIGMVAMWFAERIMDVMPGTNWSNWAIFTWLIFYVYHVVKVFIINAFMGREWEKKQIEKYVNKQEKQINKIIKNQERQQPSQQETTTHETQNNN